VSAAQDDGSRAIRAISDLSHQSGKLGAYRALIIGISDYVDTSIPDLETPLNDATALADLLRTKYGFKVQLLLDRKATKKAIFNALRSLAASTKQDDSVLIYFAGHGDIDRIYNDGWWIPADARGGDPLTYLDNVQVQKSMRSMKARHALLISDSCYSGTLFGKARAMPSVITDKYYLSLYNEKSRWGMTSGNKEPVSDEGTENHSVFAYQLLKELRKNDKPFLSTQEIYTRIAPIVSNNSEQTPLCRPIRNTGDQGGEFIFVAALRKESKVVSQSISTISKPQKNDIDKEMLFWQSIQNSDDKVLFEAYIEKFPNGTFVPIAKRKIKALTQKKVVSSIAPKILPEAITTGTLHISGSPYGAEVYLDRKPAGKIPILIKNIEAGRHTLEVFAYGYEPEKKELELDANEEERISISLNAVATTGDSDEFSYHYSFTRKEGHYVDRALEKLIKSPKGKDIVDLLVGDNLEGNPTLKDLKKAGVEVQKDLSNSGHLSTVKKMNGEIVIYLAREVLRERSRDHGIVLAGALASAEDKMNKSEGPHSKVVDYYIQSFTRAHVAKELGLKGFAHFAGSDVDQQLNFELKILNNDFDIASNDVDEGYGSVRESFLKTLSLNKGGASITPSESFYNFSFLRFGQEDSNLFKSNPEELKSQIDAAKDKLRNRYGQ